MLERTYLQLKQKKKTALFKEVADQTYCNKFLRAYLNLLKKR